MDYCIALTTAGSDAEAAAIATALVEANLAACVSTHPIQSIYRWKGAIQREAEWQLVIKTTLDNYEALCEKIQALHSYEVPEVIVVRIERGSPAYLSWLAAQLSQTHKQLRINDSKDT